MQLAKLRAWRESRGLSQRELAELGGFSAFSVSRAENGASVRPATARAYAEALGVEVADLLESPPVALGKAEAPQETGRPEAQDIGPVSNIEGEDSEPPFISPTVDDLFARVESGELTAPEAAAIYHARLNATARAAQRWERLMQILMLSSRNAIGSASKKRATGARLKRRGPRLSARQSKSGAKRTAGSGSSITEATLFLVPPRPLVVEARART
jgi:transcriptional regulator with XRE-family HTH domain